MLQAKVYDAEGYCGTITWTGSQFSLDPANSQLLNNMLTLPVYVPIGGGLEDVYASTDPVLFMTHLFRHYKSYALNVSEAVDPEEEEEEDKDSWRPLLPDRPGKG